MHPLDDVVQYDSEECSDGKISCLIREANNNTVLIRMKKNLTSN